jgi:Rod binding domain-containing protein
MIDTTVMPTTGGSGGPETAQQRLRQTFDSFVGQTFYGQMLKAMRSTLGKPAYFHGGRAEEVFQAQLDQTLAEKMAAANGGAWTQGMFEQFQRSLGGLARR